MANTNGNSYQKYDGATGTYQEATNGNGTSSGSPRRFKWLIGAAAVAVLGTIYAVTSSKSPQAVVQKAIATSGAGLQVKNGKLKLFDDLSTCSGEKVSSRRGLAHESPQIAT